MWGTLHVNQRRELVGWIVDTWTEVGVEPHLLPKMHWVPREDGKFYHMRLNIDFRSSLEIFHEDTDIEPHRAAFVKATLALWEQEWLDQK